jgi:hypothetical protein
MSNKNQSTVRVLGGLGNQLFGLFFGLAIAKELNNKLLLDPCLINFGSNSNRELTLNKLDPIYEKTEIKENSIKISRIISRSRLLKRVYWKYLNSFTKNVKEGDLSNPKFRFRSNQIFQGYFQNWFYVDRFSKLSSKFGLSLKQPSKNFQETLKELQRINPICLHLREGDYIQFPEIFKIIPQKYFDFALNREFEKDAQREVWIFTEQKDLLQEYKNEFLNKAARIIDKNSGLTELESFLLMANCKTIIATNSTYSLWAAWFVWKSGNTAYVPYQSYIEGVSNDLMDERWNRYDFEKDFFYPGKFNQEKYEQLEREFLSKFS